MSKQLASVDAGNGGTNGIKANDKSMRTIYFPSVRAVATGDSLGLGADFEMQYEYIDWGGHRYIVGDDVISVSRKSIERHQGAFRYGDEFHQFLVATALARLGIHQGDVDLTLFSPPGIYNEARPRMIERFTDNGGNVAIKLSGDEKPRKWKYSSVTVLPEGIGAAACFALDADGKPTNQGAILAGETVIIDLGMYTLDAVQMSDGNFNPESLSTATWENQGLKNHILDPSLRRIHKMGTDFTLLTVDDVDFVLRQGLLTQNYTMRVAGIEVDLKPVFDKYATRYADWIANNIVDGVFNGLRGVKSLILVGGGAALTSERLSQLYPEKLMNLDSIGVDPVDANVTGGIRLAKRRLTSK